MGFLSGNSPGNSFIDVWKNSKCWLTGLITLVPFINSYKHLNAKTMTLYKKKNWIEKEIPCYSYTGIVSFHNTLPGKSEY